MAATWFLLDGQQSITGWQSGLQAPDGAPLATDNDIAAYRLARDAMTQSGRDDMPQLIDGAVVIPADTRLIFRVTCDRAADPQLGYPVMDADGVDFVTVTVEKMIDDSTPDTSFDSVLYFNTASRTFKMQFIAGVSQKQFSSRVSGRFDVSSRPGFRVVSPFAVIAAE